MKRSITNPGYVCIILSFLFLPLFNGNTQTGGSAIPRDTIMHAALEIIHATPFCALVTIDSTGQSQVRTMNPFPISDDWIIWFATSRESRKVKVIRNNPKVSVYYADHMSARGYVNINGTAEIIDDKDLLVRKKREYWEGIPNWKDVFVLIKITPKTMDVINYAHGLNGDPGTNRAATLVF